ncbi:MAG: sensor histidine kinase [bacterium]|nr:sensor histidine kinase [bacterium]
MGYTSAGLKEESCMLSPGMEELTKALIRLLESDQLLKANKRQAQYLALQNQINPHFLYNTLDSIRSEAMLEGNETVAEMTEALASFFRYTISNVENMVTLEEELENTKVYFLIQKHRFEDRVNLEIEYDKEDEFLLRCLLPKLTIQPVVENSIIHGIERKVGSGLIRILLKCTEKRLIIEIKDDGVGMQPEVLEKLNQQLEQPVYESIQLSKEKGGIAIANVNNRIHLIFGEEYGMTAYSTPNVGTDIIINLPLITSERQIKDLKE